jgi:hypothetical protein
MYRKAVGEEKRATVRLCNKTPYRRGFRDDKAPMLEAPASVLRAVAASGYQKKLAIAFTHFDLVRGQANLPTFEAQRAHVLSSVYQKLVSLREVVGQPAVRAIERELDERCFMLGFLDRQPDRKQSLSDQGHPQSDRLL